MTDRLQRGLAALDALHAEDPRTVEVDGRDVAAELVYARRMSEALASLRERPSEALSLAVRAQHLCRWRLPRADYPLGRAGYHAWRREQARRHGELAAATLRDVGYDEATIAQVVSLIEKRRRDAESQTLEDAACLVFLAHELEGFAAGREDAQLVEILRKTWRKMSDTGRERALALPLDARSNELLAVVLAE